MLLACELLNQTGDKVPVLITDMCTSGLSTLCFSQSIEPPDADNNFTRQELDPGVKVATTRVGLLYKGSSPTQQYSPWENGVARSAAITHF